MHLRKFAASGALLALCVALPPAVSAAPLKGGKTAAKRSEPAKRAEKALEPQFGVAPAWVKSEATPPPNTERAKDPFQFLLSNSQELLTREGVQNYLEYVVLPQNQAGLQAVGTVTIPWNIDRADLVINAVQLERDGETIDVLDRSQVTVIQRETKLEQSQITGIRTVVLPVRGIRVGDRLRVGVTYRTRPRSWGQTEELQDIVVPLPIVRSVRRFIIAKDLDARWSLHRGFKAIRTGEVAEGTEHVFQFDKLEPMKERSFVPERFKHKLVQVSAYRSWNDVAAALRPMFDEARLVAANSHVAAAADKIMAAHADPHARLLAALRLAQDEVRYVAMLLGDGDYKPMTADEVWSQRFGDCKGKTALLLALLDRMGIKAEPMLASTKLDDLLPGHQPSLAMLDHVLVRASVGGQTYYLDGTKYGERTLEELKQSPVVYGLPLVENASLVTTPSILPSAPLAETQVTWDARNGVTHEVPFEAVLILRGTEAAQMRALAASSNDEKKLIDKVKDRVAAVSNEALEFVSSDPEAPDGSYIFKFNGKIQMDWTPVEGLKGNRMQFSQSTLNWDGEFDRDDEPGKAIPVKMTFPYWERTVERVLLPDGGKAFVLDATPIDKTVAVTHLTRSVGMTAGVATAISDFKRLKPELDAETARAAKTELEKIGESYGYVVSRRKLKLPD